MRRGFSFSHAGVVRMTEEKIEAMAEKYRLGAWHQIVSTFGIPLIMVMGGVIGTLISMQVNDLRSDVRAALDMGQKAQTSVAVLERSDNDQERRIASLEDWRSTFQSFTPRRP